MKLIVLLFILVFHLSTAGQQKSFPVSLKSEQGSGPFYNQFITTGIEPQTLPFKGIPANLVDYRIERLHLWVKHSILYILYGITSSQQRMIMFDSDFDHDFSGEKMYLFDNDIRYSAEKEKAVLDTTSFTELKPSNNTSFFARPDVYNAGTEYDTKEDSIWHLELEFRNHSEGTFNVKHKKFKIVFSNSPYFKFFTQNLESFYISLYDHSLDTQSISKPPFLLKEPIYADHEEFVIDSLSEDCSTAWISYLGHVDKQFGTREGAYASNIIATTINNRSFNLHQLKGKYVLLDFWGTWCVPCIVEIPRLRQLNKMYQRKGLVMVSIADDTKKSYNKLLSLIRDKQMTWIQIFDNQEADNNITALYHISSFPTQLLIDPSGKIILINEYGEFETLKNKLRQIFK